MKKLKRSLRGYSPAAVRGRIHEMQENHRIRMAELAEQSKLLAEECDRLEDELALLAEADKRKPAVLTDQLAARRLLEAHLEQTESVWQAMQELKALEDEHRAEVAGKQSEIDQLLENIEFRLKETLRQLAEGRGRT